MDPSSIILEISSDEEGAWEEVTDDNYDWISELLSPVGNETEESDDVVFVDEVRPSFVTQKQNYRPSDAAKPKDVSDDECMILDGDPDNPVAVVNDTVDESEELLIVSEKGQLACRDYPHPRHLCAKFPFGSTPHEKYCDLCHCYVCDSLAPCAYWGSGLSSTDHCHAIDKEEIWKEQRICLKQGKAAPPAFQKLPASTLSMMPFSSNTTQTPHRLIPPNCGFVPIQSPSSSTHLRACSSTTNFSTPNIINPRRNPRSGVIHSRNRFSQDLSRSQLVSGTTNLIRKVRYGPHFYPPKRVGTLGCGSTINQRAGYGPYGLSSNNNLACTSQQPRRHAIPILLNKDRHTRWQGILSGNNPDVGSCQRSSQPNMGITTDFQSYPISSQPQAYGQPILQQNDGHNLYAHGNSASNVTNANPLYFSSREINTTTQGIRLSTVMDPKLQSPQSNLDPLTVTESNIQYPSSNNPVPSDFHGEDWVYADEQSILGITEDYVPCEPDQAFPQPDPVDPAMIIFDFETSLDQLAQE